MPVPIPILEIEIIQIIDAETLHTINKEIIPRIVIETIQTIEDLNIQQIKIVIVIKIDHATIHKTEVQALTKDKGTTLNHHIGTTHVIKYQNKIIGAVHLNIKDK